MRPSILDLTAEIAPRGLRGGPAVSQKSGAAAPWERLAGVGRFRDSEHEKEKGLHRAEEKLMADSPRALARTGRERNARFTVRKKISLGEIQSAMREMVRARFRRLICKREPAGWRCHFIGLGFVLRARKSRRIRVGLLPGRVLLGDDVEEMNRTLPRGPGVPVKERAGPSCRSVKREGRGVRPCAA